MAIDSKNLLVWVKAMSRGQNLPLDASEIHDSKAAAEVYAASPTAYAGQTIKAMLEDGKYHEYVLQPDDGGLTLEEVGAVSAADLKQYVVVADELPESGQEEGVIYIQPKVSQGSIWDGSSWKTVFKDYSVEISAVEARVDSVEGDLEGKAPLTDPEFTGTVKVNGSEVSTKAYVESLVAQLAETTVPDIIDDEHPEIMADYKAGQMWRVAISGNFAGEMCEPGDLIICLKDYDVSKGYSTKDFMVVQANIDGAVTSKAETTQVGELVMFDSTTGKTITNSDILYGDVMNACSTAHDHENWESLVTYNKTQTELLAAANAYTDEINSDTLSAMEVIADGKADKATTLAGYGIEDVYNKTEMDSKLDLLTQNLNTKMSAEEVDKKISASEAKVTAAAAADAAEKLAARVGDIPEETDLKTYIDTAVGSGGTSSAQAIAQAKQEAIDTSKEYTNSALQIKEF